MDINIYPSAGTDTGRERGSAPGIGSSSVIMVFTLLCLTVFATMTLLSASSELKLARSYSTAVEQFYAADTAGAAYVAALRDKADSIASGVPGADDYAAAAHALGADAVVDNDIAYIEYDIPESDSQTLHISLEASAERFAVTAWQLIYTGEWNADTGLNLWPGN